jgi:hypothetical protein
MFQEPIESLPFLSADNAFPGDKTLEVSTVLPVLQLESFELGTIPAEMVRMAGTREFLIRAHPSAAPTKMPMSFEFLYHNQIAELQTENAYLRDFRRSLSTTTPFSSAHSITNSLWASSR